ncbi:MULTISPECIES: hypothetical protein [Cupriavidus]
MRWKLIWLVGVVVPALARAQVPEPVVNSCLFLESESRTVSYAELQGAGFLSEDMMPGYSALIYRKDGSAYGYASSLRNDRDLLLVGRKKLPIFSARPMGSERPRRFDPAKAVYAVVGYAARRYFCVASDFDGLGRSGSFQNVRAAYIVPLTFSRGKPGASTLYYTVRDIREVRQATP